MAGETYKKIDIVIPDALIRNRLQPPDVDIFIVNASHNNHENASYRTDYTNATQEYEDYVYEFQEIPQAEEIVPLALVYGLTLLLGVIGNTLVIISVTRYQRMRSITNIFLLSLASADLLLVSVCIPIKFAAFFTFSWTFGELLCKSVYYVQNVSSVCSVLTLTTMSVERYYAIRHPIRAKYMCTIGRAWRVTCFLWTMSLILATPTFFQRVHMLVGGRVKAYWCLKNWESPIQSRMYELYMLALMLVLPLGVMTFSYASIIKELWTMASLRSNMTSGYGIKSPQQGPPVSATTSEGNHEATKNCRNHAKSGSVRFTFRNSHTSLTPASSCVSSPSRLSEKSPIYQPRPTTTTTTLREDDDRTKKQVIKMLVAVIVVFVLCWAPILINNTLTAFGHLHYLNYGFLKPMRQIFYILAYANSCINPFIYGFMSQHFRKTFYHALCTCCKSPKETRSHALRRRTSWHSRSTNIRELGDVELTSIEVTGCGNCSINSV